MVGFFDDAVIPVGDLEFVSNAYRKITVAGFKKENSPIALLWYKDQIPGDDLDWDLVELTIKNTNFRDPVYIEMISGKVYDIDESDWKNKGKDVEFKRLPVWDSVVMIADRSNVDFTSRP